MSLEIEQSDQSDVGFSFPSLPVPIQPSTAAPVLPAAASVGGQGKVGVVPAAGGRGTVGVPPVAALSTKDPNV